MIFLNGYDERIVNGVSKTLVEGDYFCTTCFDKENSNLIAYKENLIKEALHGGYASCGSENPMDSPLEADQIRGQKFQAKEKLNEVCRCFGLPTIEDT